MNQVTVEVNSPQAMLEAITCFARVLDVSERTVVTHFAFDCLAFETVQKTEQWSIHGREAFLRPFVLLTHRQFSRPRAVISIDKQRREEMNRFWLKKMRHTADELNYERRPTLSDIQTLLLVLMGFSEPTARHFLADTKISLEETIELYLAYAAAIPVDHDLGRRLHLLLNVRPHGE